jgi:glycosyltransferase involved in cell wall biosynthesis
MLRSLRVRGPFRGPSGYDHHVREITREFVRRGIRVQLIDITDWTAVRIPERDRDPLFESLQAPVDAPITLHFSMPHQVTSDDDSLHVNYTTFEATRIPRHWVEHNLRHALVIVPTESSRAAWLASGVPDERIRVCPEGVDPAVFGRKMAALRLATETGRPISSFRARFLNVSEVGPRKNIEGLLRAWLMATRQDDDAILILKLGRHVPGRLQPLVQQIRSVERSVGRSFNDAAPVEILFDLLAEPAMPRLYTAATHYISMSHGEGWDHPMVEAAACGLHLIAPDHSAYRAYLTPEIATLLPCRQVPARFEGDPELQTLFDGAEWWEPDQDAAVTAIRAAIEEPCPRPSPARDAILSTISWQKATGRLLDILNELLLTA